MGMTLPDLHLTPADRCPPSGLGVGMTLPDLHLTAADRCPPSGLGVGMTRDSSALMVGQYFKRRRELVEIFVVSGSGLGVTVMSSFVNGTVR